MLSLFIYVYIYKNTKNNLQNDIISYITREFRYSIFRVGAPCKVARQISRNASLSLRHTVKQNIM